LKNVHHFSASTVSWWFFADYAPPKKLKYKIILENVTVKKPPRNLKKRIERWFVVGMRYYFTNGFSTSKTWQTLESNSKTPHVIVFPESFRNSTVTAQFTVYKSTSGEVIINSTYVWKNASGYVVAQNDSDFTMDPDNLTSCYQIGYPEHVFQNLLVNTNWTKHWETWPQYTFGIGGDS